MLWCLHYHLVQKMKFFIKGFFSKCDQISSFHKDLKTELCFWWTSITAKLKI